MMHKRINTSANNGRGKNEAIFSLVVLCCVFPSYYVSASKTWVQLYRLYTATIYVHSAWIFPKIFRINGFVCLSQRPDTRTMCAFCRNLYGSIAHFHRKISPSRLCESALCPYIGPMHTVKLDKILDATLRYLKYRKMLDIKRFISTIPISEPETHSRK